MKNLTSTLLAILLFVFSVQGQVSKGRVEVDLSGKGWQLWLDRAAVWYTDTVFMPPVDISKLKSNLPSVGWEALHNKTKVNFKSVEVPGTVEQYYWGDIGGAIPDTGGNYIGVSWWSKSFSIGTNLQGKRITLNFESVNLRAEIFVNGILTGYDVIGNTPFEVDITKAVKYGAENFLDIRITDPVGNFSWDDNRLMRWGKNLVPAIHGFGGITGGITMRATDVVAINDIYVQNQPDPKKVKVFVTLDNYAGPAVSGTLNLIIKERGNPAIIIARQSETVSALSGKKTIAFSPSTPNAKLWNLAAYKSNETATLYDAEVNFTSADGRIVDNGSQRFGFRWFEAKEKDGDKRFYLNGNRVFILSAMSRGFWPTNGMFPTREMVRREVKTMRDLGLNTMYMHRAIGQPGVYNYADSVGFFTYEEPGGYRLMPNRNDGIDKPDDLAKSWRREKLRRMIIRDRSLPSSIIYYLKNEAVEIPDQDDVENMKMIHKLDPSRFAHYNSGHSINTDPQKEAPNEPTKLHMMPFDDSLYYYGWWDQHHWFPYSGYVDEMYENPEFYLRGVINGSRSLKPQDSIYRLDKKEIIFWGEEGAFGTMVRLQKIKEELDSTDDAGYREKEHKDWYAYYDKFLDETGFRKSFPTVDALTLSLGRNLSYFHGRNIENVRLSDIGDAYNMNGWASESTRTDVVDMYRNPTADPSIISYYTQPLYIAVKIRDKVLSVGAVPVADFFIINEKNLRGKHRLFIEFKDPAGKVVFNKEAEVNISGGEKFGQLILRGIELPVIRMQGYYTLNAKLSSKEIVAATGFDNIYAVDLSNHVTHVPNIAVVENDNVIKDFIQKRKGTTVSSFIPTLSSLDKIIIGNINFADIQKDVLEDIMMRVKEGTELIVLQNADYFAQQVNTILKTRPALYDGSGIIRWNSGGRLFVGQSKFLNGLPESQGMSWEYQCFYKTNDPQNRNGMASGLRLNHWGSELIVALGSQGSKEILSSLSSIRVGKGDVILSTLNILPNLQSQESSSVVAKKLFLNLIEY